MSVSIFIAYNTCMGFDFRNEWAMVTGGSLWQWIGKRKEKTMQALKTTPHIN